jgi:hypothetical protein
MSSLIGCEPHLMKMGSLVQIPFTLHLHGHVKIFFEYYIEIPLYVHKKTSHKMLARATCISKYTGFHGYYNTKKGSCKNFIRRFDFASKKCISKKKKKKK